MTAHSDCTNYVYIGAATKHLTPQAFNFLASFGGPGDLNASGGGFFCSSSNGLPLLLLHPKPPPEAFKSPGPPNLAKQLNAWGVECLVAAL